MPNGAAVALPRELDPPAVATTEVERRIGEVTAEAAIMVFAGMEEVQAGGLTPATRSRAGELLVQLYQLQESALGKIDFNATARREGKRILWERYGAALRTQLNYSETTLDRALDDLIDRPLTVLRQVTAVERARMN
jgi:hypothetical protein